MMFYHPLCFVRLVATAVPKKCTTARSSLCALEGVQNLRRRVICREFRGSIRRGCFEEEPPSSFAWRNSNRPKIGNARAYFSRL